MNSAERTAGELIEVIGVDMMKVPQGFGRLVTHQPRELCIASFVLAGRHSGGGGSCSDGRAAEAMTGHVEAREIH